MYIRCLRTIFILYLITFILSSCSYKQQQILFEQKSSVPDTSFKNSTSSLKEYHIKSQDILQIRNLQNIRYIVDETPVSTASAGGTQGTGQGQTYQVENDGTVTLPVIGHMHVAGLTRSEAAKQIEDNYRKNLLKDPIIEVKIVNLKVTVLGEIKVQGNYPLTKDNTTLVDIIGQAGGLTDKANEKYIKIIRGGHDHPEVIIADLSDIRTLSNPNIIMQNEDIVYVSENKRAVRTDKLQNFTTLTQPALLILNTALIIYSLFRK